MNQNYFPEVGHKVTVQTPFGSRNAFVVEVVGSEHDEDYLASSNLIEVKIQFEKALDKVQFHDQFERHPQQDFRTLYLGALRNCMISWS